MRIGSVPANNEMTTCQGCVSHRRGVVVPLAQLLPVGFVPSIVPLAAVCLAVIRCGSYVVAGPLSRRLGPLTSSSHASHCAPRPRAEGPTPSASLNSPARGVISASRGSLGRYEPNVAIRNGLDSMRRAGWNTYGEGRWVESSRAKLESLTRVLAGAEITPIDLCDPLLGLQYLLTSIKLGPGVAVLHEGRNDHRSWRGASRISQSVVSFGTRGGRRTAAGSAHAGPRHGCPQRGWRADRRATRKVQRRALGAADWAEPARSTSRRALCIFGPAPPVGNGAPRASGHDARTEAEIAPTVVETSLRPAPSRACLLDRACWLRPTVRRHRTASRHRDPASRVLA